MEIFMLAAGSLSWGRFVELLRKHGIERVVDVRATTFSGLPWVCEGALKRALQRIGPAGQVGYQRWEVLSGHRSVGAQAARYALGQVLDAASCTRTVLLCREIDRRLATLVIEMGWRAFELAHSGQVVELKQDSRLASEARATEARSKRWRPITPPLRPRATLSD